VLIRNEDGLYQVVKRKNGTVFIRKFTRTNTEAQAAVRAKLAFAALSSYGMPREKVVENVARNVKPVTDRNFMNTTERELAEKYPEVYSIVLKHAPVRASRMMAVERKEVM
jgi:hypothetical protein